MLWKDDICLDDTTEGVIVEEKEGVVKKLEPIELINNPPGENIG
jgi:hypothetical protein